MWDFIEAAIVVLDLFPGYPSTSAGTKPGRRAALWFGLILIGIGIVWHAVMRYAMNPAQKSNGWLAMDILQAIMLAIGALLLWQSWRLRRGASRKG